MTNCEINCGAAFFSPIALESQAANPGYAGHRVHAAPATQQTAWATAHQRGISRREGLGSVDVRKAGGIGQHGENIVTLEVRIIQDDLFNGHATGQPFQD